MTLSLLAQYDEIVRLSNVLHDGASEPEFLRFVLNVDDLRIKLSDARKECERLMCELQNANATRSHLEHKLETARQMVDMENKKRKSAESKVNDLENQLALVRDLVWDGRNKLHDETRERLASVYNQSSTCASFGAKSCGLRDSFANRLRESEGGLSRISEALDSTGSLISELGYTRSEDELEISRLHSPGFRKHRRSHQLDAPAGPKKPRSSYTTLQSAPSRESNQVASKECLVATTTVTMSRAGPVTAKSVIETLPSQEKLTISSQTNGQTPHTPLQPKSSNIPSAPPAPSSESEESMICCKEPPTGRTFYSGINIMARDKLNYRAHIFCQKTIIKADICEPCGKRFKFGKIAAKCRDCRATVHLECKEKLPLPCVPATCTPTAKGQLGVISDYTPSVPPMIPALIVHCINEIEARGLKEVGIYRVSGSERDVKMLKEKFLRGRGAPNLSNVDIHVICGAVKDFLRSLREPLVTPSLVSDFFRCIEPSEESDQQAHMYQVVADLPRPNRDTLAFMILHLQRISECPECKMPVDNLAKVFGPTIVGYSSANSDPQAMMIETVKQVAVMQLMLKSPSSYWACHVNSSYGTPLCENRTPETTGYARRNPSSSSIQRSGFFTTPVGTFKRDSHHKLYHSSGICSAYDKLFYKEHVFCQKTMFKLEKCGACAQKIKLGQVASKCQECLIKVHNSCTESLAMPCVPAGPKHCHRCQLIALSDVCSRKFPMIPALIIHCIKEVEARGMEERFIYQIPASECDVSVLKEKFLHGLLPKLSQVNIHIVCGILKDFLLSLKEPLVTPSMWSDFVKCLEYCKHNEKELHLFQTMLKLKQPERNTLSCIILHLQRIAGSSKTLMPINSLARLFGPTIIGFSSSNPSTSIIMEESVITVDLMKLMLKTPSSYWNYILNLSHEEEIRNHSSNKNWS